MRIENDRKISKSRKYQFLYFYSFCCSLRDASVPVGKIPMLLLHLEATSHNPLHLLMTLADNVPILLVSLLCFTISALTNVICCMLSILICYILATYRSLLSIVSSITATITIEELVQVSLF